MTSTESTEPLTEQWARNTLRRYQELDERADYVAAIVYHERFPKSVEKCFHHSYDFDTGYSEMVDSAYFASGGDDYIRWPLDLLWADDETIVRRTHEQIEEEKLKAEQRKAQQQAEQEQSERANYERLKAKYG
jgi:hypothetical protein